jgi:hypothetical protein
MRLCLGIKRRRRGENRRRLRLGTKRLLRLNRRRRDRLGRPSRCRRGRRRGVLFRRFEFRPLCQRPDCGCLLRGCHLRFNQTKKAHSAAKSRERRSNEEALVARDRLGTTTGAAARKPLCIDRGCGRSAPSDGRQALNGPPPTAKRIERSLPGLQTWLSLLANASP